MFFFENVLLRNFFPSAPFRLIVYNYTCRITWRNNTNTHRSRYSHGGKMFTSICKFAVNSILPSHIAKYELPCSKWVNNVLLLLVCHFIRYIISCCNLRLLCVLSNRASVAKFVNKWRVLTSELAELFCILAIWPIRDYMQFVNFWPNFTELPVANQNYHATEGPRSVGIRVHMELTRIKSR